jgi:hypothetical protein
VGLIGVDEIIELLVHVISGRGETLSKTIMNDILSLLDGVYEMVHSWVV